MLLRQLVIYVPLPGFLFPTKPAPNVCCTSVNLTQPSGLVAVQVQVTSQLIQFILVNFPRFNASGRSIPSLQRLHAAVGHSSRWINATILPHPLSVSNGAVGGPPLAWMLKAESAIWTYRYTPPESIGSSAPSWIVLRRSTHFLVFAWRTPLTISIVQCSHTSTLSLFHTFGIVCSITD